MQLLSSRDRDLLNLKYQSSQSVKEIAAAVCRTESAVYKALERIHDDLFDCVEGKLKGSNRQ